MSHVKKSPMLNTSSGTLRRGGLAGGSGEFAAGLGADVVFRPFPDG
jgi:hypothetical protein